MSGSKRARRWLSIAMLCLAATGCGSSSSSTTSVTAPSDVRCTVSLTAPPMVASGGGSGRLTVGVNRECTWTAKAEVNWITVTPGSGQGEASLTYTVAANPQITERKGGINVNGRRVELTQAGAPCSFTISPRESSVAATAERRTISVTAQAGCEWTATSQSSWLTVASGRSGEGNGSVTVEIAPNTGAARTGTVRIAGRTYTVSQAAMDAPAPPPAPPAPPDPPPTPPPTPPPAPPAPPACAITLSETTRAVAAAGGSGSVNVRTDAACEWTAVSNATWLTITGSPSGSGNGTVQYAIAANTTQASRSGTITIGERTLTVTQAAAAACSYDLSDTSQSFSALGGTDTVDVETSNDCDWTATSNASWLTITSASTGTGDGTVRYAVAPNLALTSRTGVLTIASLTLTVTQQAAIPQDVELRGDISGLSGSCPNLTFSVDGRTVRTTNQTDVRRGACSDLRNGTEVTVEGSGQADDSVLARRITIENDDEDD